MPSTMRTPNANILRELPERDHEWAARGTRFAGSADERQYAAELLGRAIGHAAVMLPAWMAVPGAAVHKGPRLPLAGGYCADGCEACRAAAGRGDTPADVAAAADAGRWQAYAAVAAMLGPALRSFGPCERMAVAAAMYPVVGL